MTGSTLLLGSIYRERKAPEGGMKRTGARGNHPLSPEGIAQGASILFTETPRSWAAVGWSGRSGVVARPPMTSEHYQHLISHTLPKLSHPELIGATRKASVVTSDPVRVFAVLRD